MNRNVLLLCYCFVYIQTNIHIFLCFTHLILCTWFSFLLVFIFSSPIFRFSICNRNVKSKSLMFFSYCCWCKMKLKFKSYSYFMDLCCGSCKTKLNMNCCKLFFFLFPHIHIESEHTVYQTQPQLHICLSGSSKRYEHQQQHISYTYKLLCFIVNIW